MDNAKPQLLWGEAGRADGATDREEVRLTKVQAKKDLSILKNKHQVHKFIYNTEGTLAIGSISKAVCPKSLSHPALATWADGGEVVSAGYLHRFRKTIYVVNHSGHYRPDFERLKPVARHIGLLGLKVREIKAGTLRHRLLQKLA